MYLFLYNPSTIGTLMYSSFIDQFFKHVALSKQQQQQQQCYYTITNTVNKHNNRADITTLGRINLPRQKLKYNSVCVSVSVGRILNCIRVHISAALLHIWSELLKNSNALF